MDHYYGDLTMIQETGSSQLKETHYNSNYTNITTNNSINYLHNNNSTNDSSIRYSNRYLGFRNNKNRLNNSSIR
ncbi:hypothetical protein GGI07_003032 [Coemansia sp. Benny D115]|nr:hypothetical protein GGI07_003032 [Coemansia sp. Benny D115]